MVVFVRCFLCKNLKLPIVYRCVFSLQFSQLFNAPFDLVNSEPSSLELVVSLVLCNTKPFDEVSEIIKNRAFFTNRVGYILAILIESG